MYEYVISTHVVYTRLNLLLASDQEFVRHQTDLHQDTILAHHNIPLLHTKSDTVVTSPSTKIETRQ